MNEAQAIGRCVAEAFAAIDSAGVSGEVLVVDNGSSDGSAEIARAGGARVIEEPHPGYGNAYIAGLRAARGRAILMGDGDGTYDFGELAKFLDLLNAGAEIVMG
ncbi:MAG: glycosyltransferase family 2 protein, partial [Actinomycetota bacterium]|nr:glycosyltransferase family 2 protein [Actinomycetota bacterium]